MNPETLTAIQIAVTLVGMFVAPWLAVKWSLKQFRSQSWLQEQHDTYSKLLQSLSVIRHDNRLDLWAETEGYSRSPEHLRQLVRESRQHIMRYLDHGSYLISDDAAEALRYVLTSDVVEDNPILQCENLEDRLEKAITILRAEANIRVKPKSLPA
jgi:hypothetical protein